MQGTRHVLDKKIALIAASLLILISCGQDDSVPSKPLKIESLGHLNVGDSVPGFAGTSKEGSSFAHNEPKGNFYVYFINDELPPACLNNECANADLIQKHGGQLMGGSDGKLAKMFGANIVSSREYQLDNSILVLANNSPIITAIYKNVRKEHIAEIARRELRIND